MRGGGLFRARIDSNAKLESAEASPAAPSDENARSATPVNNTLQLKTSTTNHQKFLPDFSITNDTFLTRDEVFANFTFNLASGTRVLNNLPYENICFCQNFIKRSTFDQHFRFWMKFSSFDQNFYF